MKIRLHFPLSVIIFGKSPNDLYFKTHFRHNEFLVNIEFLGEKPLSPNSAPEGKDFGRLIRSIEFVIEEIRIKQIKESKYPTILKVITPIINRVLRNIRNFGIVPHIREINPDIQDSRHYLLRWNVEYSYDNENWNAVVKKELWDTLSLMLIDEETRVLYSFSLLDIEESIQDDLTASPEQEFTTNAIEHLRNRNYRLALVESIISLEIVMTQFLKTYLYSFHKLSKTRISKFLNPQLGLTARVSGLLDLCLNPNDIKNIKYDNVLKAIEWRNEVIHDTGHIKSNIDDKDISEKIFSVIKLCYLLADRYIQLKAEPELK